MCREAGFTPDVVMECFHCHMVELVSAGYGVALMTRERALKNRGNEMVAMIPIKEPEYTMKYYLTWKAGHHFNKISIELRKYLKEQCSQDFGGCSGC